VKFRGYSAVAVVCLGLLVADVIERFIVGPLAWLLPSCRTAILHPWIQAMAWLGTRPIAVIGGAHMPFPPVVPFEPGVLIVMNHQSLFDIPILIKSLRPGYPRILTRKRYARWIPLISHLARVYQYPIVNPEGTVSELRRSFRELEDAARTSTVPLAFFPEGTRTRDGEIGRFRTKGMAVILGARPWKVYIMVVDGFWNVARFKDFIGGVGELRGRMELAGVMEWTDPEADPRPFVKEMREVMVQRLADMRAETSVA
jgi:1-acyl-sn-glycerol-3-phosphate acyltransferase